MYWPSDTNKIPDLLDFFIIRKLPVAYIKVEKGYDLCSDHTSIILILSERVMLKENNLTLTNRQTEWERFKLELNKRINLKVPLKTNEQLDQEVEKIIKDIQQAAWNNTPKIKKKTSGNNYQKEIRELVTEKRKARKKWQYTRSSEDKNKYNRLAQQLRREI